MKLVRVNITAFGKLKNVAFDFADGVNILQQQNGFGKSTLCAFVRAMLYGLNYNYKLTSGVRMSDVTRYKPWDSTAKFGGSMEICHQCKHYHIERFFGSTAKNESLTVVELATGRQLNIPYPGEYFLGLTVDSYDRCTYLPQEQIDIVSNENLDGKLANLQEKLRAYKKSLQHERGMGGQIPALEKEIFELQRKLANAQGQVQNRKRMSEQLVQIESAIAQLEQEEGNLKLSIDSLQQSLFQSKPSQADMELAQKIDDVEQKLASVPQTITEDFVTFNNLQEQTKALEGKHNQKTFGGKWLAICIAAAVVLVAVLAVAQLYLFAGIAAALSVGAILLLVASNSKKNSQQIEQLHNQIEQIASKYINPNGKSFHQICSEFWKYHNDYQTNLAVRKALGEKPIIKGDDNKIEWQLNQAKGKLASVVAQREQLTKTAHQLQFELSQPMASTVEIAEELLAKEQLLQEAKHNYQVATQTANLLAQAKESLSSAYIPDLCKRTEKLLNAVTNGNYKVVADRTFAISLQENGQTKPLVAFSRGVKEITVLCFRIALAELIYGKDIPLLIVDDAFVNFDEQNFNKATALLKQLSQTTQVIYFTCHDRIGQL